MQSTIFVISVLGSLLTAEGVPLSLDTELDDAFPYTASLALHQFTFDFYSKLAQEFGPEENIVMSPISLFEVFSILASGLGGNSFVQLQDAMGMSDVANSFEVETQMCDAVFEDSAYYTMSRANRVYVEQSIQLIKSFKHASEEHHHASVKKVDFINDPEGSRGKINRFVSKATDREIREFIPEGGITSMSRISLINAIKLNVAWDKPFNKTFSKLRPFHVNSTETIQVPTMIQWDASNNCLVEYDLDLQVIAVVLPFSGKALSMVIFMPMTTGDFTSLEDSTAGGKIHRLLNSIWSNKANDNYPYLHNCVLEIPKFSIKHTVDDLVSTLKLMGVTDIFEAGRGDFSNMSPQENLFVSNIRHEATVKFDEGGVKATAASSVGIHFRSMPSEVLLNKPFMYLIRHESTGAILFMGKVVRPSFKEN